MTGSGVVVEQPEQKVTMCFLCGGCLQESRYTSVWGFGARRQARTRANILSQQRVRVRGHQVKGHVHRVSDIASLGCAQV